MGDPERQVHSRDSLRLSSHWGSSPCLDANRSMDYIARIVPRGSDLSPYAHNLQHKWQSAVVWCAVGTYLLGWPVGGLVRCERICGEGFSFLLCAADIFVHHCIPSVAVVYLPNKL